MYKPPILYKFSNNVLVVSILGIGGLGKTTLAQMVYDDDTVKNHFELKMWVCVSLDFDVQKLVEKVLESATGKKPENTQFDALKNLLHEKINGRRYVLVLDDVWNEDVGKWLSLKDLLAGGAKGSKILITTRLRKFAEMSRPIYIHELNGLPQEQAWSLFKQMAFKEGEVQHPSQEVMGREIVVKCRGVPLAIRTIGGMLYSKDLESEWPLFKGKELLKMDENGSIFPILKLSYNHLPSHYKHCFAYCSLYPEDFRIPVEELIRLWKAQGYLKSTDPDECLQEVGYRWFMDLYRLSFFQDVEKDQFGKIKSCKMHDLMHDLAISVAGNNFSSSLADIKDKTQHMSFWVDENSRWQDISPLLKAKRIRTVLPLGQDYFAYARIKIEEVDEVFCNLRCLRVLSLSWLKIYKLPKSMYKLKHLRHLDLSRNKNIKKLPDSITNLLNLQVLNISECYSLKQLPNNISKLVNLTDLCNEGCNRLTHMPRGIGKLTRLEKLPLFVLAERNSMFSKHSGGLNELQGLNNLRGSLKIKNLKYVKKVDGFEFKKAILSEKLQQLTLSWIQFGNDETGLEALHPHHNLKKLDVFNYGGVKPPSWLPSLTNLVSFNIECCLNIKWLPPLDQLPHLKKLRIWGLSKLERIDVENNRGSPSSIFFPSLEKLILRDCPNLKCLPPLDQLPHLKKLEVVGLTKLERIDVENRGSSSLFFPSLEELILRDCPNMKGFERCNKTSDVVGSSLSMEELPSCFPRLSYLRIDGCPSLTCMPLFPGLKKLELDGDGVKSLMGVLKMRTTSSASESTSSSPFSTLSQLEHLQISSMGHCAMVDELVQYHSGWATSLHYKI